LLEVDGVATVEKYRIVLTEGQGEIEEKKSRFICNIRPVKTEEEAVAFIEEMKKKYWDARHNCSAFVLGKRQELTRCSDDGEPSGTAGRPMLEVLLGEELCDVAAVVTRYFGGTLLGTGGLVRAYTQAVKAGIEECETGYMKYGIKLQIETDYNGIGKIQYILGKHNIDARDAEYGTGVVMRVVIEEAKVNAVLKEITEATNGQAVVHELDKVYFLEKN